jgi:hypothetical protein
MITEVGFLLQLITEGDKFPNRYVSQKNSTLSITFKLMIVININLYNWMRITHLIPCQIRSDDDE